LGQRLFGGSGCRVAFKIAAHAMPEITTRPTVMKRGEKLERAIFVIGSVSAKTQTPMKLKA
jgi:hypothetical protein